LAWYDPSWLYRQRITLDHTLVAEDLTDFPVLITHDVVQASLFTHARSDGADIVVTAGDETTRLKRELVTYDAMGELELYVRIPSLSSLTDTEIYVYYGNAGAAETNDADTWNSDYGVVYHLKEDPAGTAPQAKDSTANAVHGTYDVAGPTVEDNTLWGGSCILFDNGPRLRVEDDPAIENADRITIEAWINTLSWPTRAVVCRKDGSYILYNYSGGFSWYLFGPDNRLQYDIAGTLVGTYDKDAGTDNQRLYLNGARVAQMSGTLPIDLNSAALGIGRHVSGIADPFNGHIDAFRIAHAQRSDGWIETTWNNMSDPGTFAVAGAEEQEGGEPPPLAGAGLVVCLMG
jgi:Concanavalin A-like lectin/glucanases superfamily